MRRSLILSCLIVLVTSAISCAQVPAWLDADKASVDDVLDALQQSGKTVKTFTAEVKMKILDETFDTSSTQSGKVWFKVKAGGDATVHVIFDHKTENNKTREQKSEWLLDDGWLTERNYTRSHEQRIQLVPAGQKMDLFQLGKGPFPLPIGQDKKDVHQQFDVTKVDADKSDPPNTVHLHLVPKSKTALEKSFAGIDVWVDGKTMMPVRVMTENAKHSEARTTDMMNLKVNPEIKPEDISLPALDVSKWTTVDKPIQPAGQNP